MTIVRATLSIIACSILCAAPAHGTEHPSLGAVIVSGSTAYSTPTLFATYRNQLGGGINSDAAQTISRALTEQYLRDGYVRPEITIDSTLAANGVLRFEVHEARITQVIFEGERGAHGVALQRIADRLIAATPLRTEHVPAALREMRALAGLTLTATARRDVARRHGMELVVRSEYSPVSGTVRLNNRGTDEIGPLMAMGQVYGNGLLGGQERLGLVFAAATRTNEYLGGGVIAETTLGDSSTRASLLLFRSRSAPREAPADLDVRYLRDRVVLRVTHPLAASTLRSLSAGGALELNDLDIRRDGTGIRDDRLRVIEGGLRGSLRRDAGAQFSASLQLRKGLEALGAGLNAPELAEDPRRADFLLVQWQGTVAWPLPAGWSTRLDTFAQYSGHVLPDSERFRIGGDRLGRGFENAEIAGDRGVGGKLELRRQLLDAGSLAGRISAYGFYDIGTAWKARQPGREAAATTGAGIGLAGAKVTGYLEIAAPLSGPDIEGRRDPSLFAEMAWHF